MNVSSLTAILIVAIMWIALLLRSKRFGWSHLGKEFPAQNRFKGKTHSSQSATGPWGMTYRRCLIFGANSEGLYIAMSPWFLSLDLPLFLPWHQITYQQTTSWLLGKRVRFYLGKKGYVFLEISPRLANELISEAGWEWPLVEDEARPYAL
jgi:hypothetical protein